MKYQHIVNNDSGLIRNQPAVVSWLWPALLYRSEGFEKLRVFMVVSDL
jgi:hypothetical protein